jgi:hypothetical protein
MTTIAVTMSDKYAYLCSESGITDESFHTMPGMPKIVRQDEWLIAAAGADRTCDVLQYQIKYPVVPITLKTAPDQKWYEWISKRVIPRIRDGAQKELSLDTKDGVAELPDSEIILVTHGRAFGISASLGISRLHPYWAIGSGGSISLGALAVTYANEPDWDIRHEDYCYSAVQAAVKHDSFSHPPIQGYKSLRTGRIIEWASKDHV